MFIVTLYLIGIANKPGLVDARVSGCVFLVAMR